MAHNYKIGETEPIMDKLYLITDLQPIKDGVDLVICKVIKKDGTLGKSIAMFNSDKRITSLRIYRS